MRKLFFVLVATMGATLATMSWAQDEAQEQYMAQWAARSHMSTQQDDQDVQRDAIRNEYVTSRISDLKDALAMWAQAAHKRGGWVADDSMIKQLPDGSITPTLYVDTGVAVFQKLGPVVFRQMPDGSIKWQITTFRSKNAETIGQQQALFLNVYWSTIQDQCSALIKHGKMTSCDKVLPKEYRTTVTQPSPTQSHIMTTADVAAFQNAHPEMPQPLGGGMYRVHLYDGGTAVMTEQQWDNYSTQHYQKCQMGIPDHCEK